LPDSPAIIIGNELPDITGYNDTLQNFIRDGILILTKGNKIYITGKRARGALFAAYIFLESLLGVYWVMPGDFGEIYPQINTMHMYQ